MSITETCQVRVPDGGRFISAHTCGKKLSGSNDYPELCGQHASVKRREQSKKAAREEASVRLNEQRDADAARVVALNAKLGTKALLRTSMATTGPEAFIGKSTGEVTVTIAELEALALRLSSPDATEEQAADALTGSRTTCPDGGICHHACPPDPKTEPCFRTRFCGPFSSYNNGQWKEDDR